MASTLCQKWFTIFCQKNQNFKEFVLYDFVEISLACFPNTCQIMYGETLDFQCQYQQWEHKIPDRKINFWSKFAVKTFPCNADIRSLKKFYTFLKECLCHMQWRSQDLPGWASEEENK